ncbi:MAG: hypothetical protein AAFP76_03170 [Bacteroidota bacterium]
MTLYEKLNTDFTQGFLGHAAIGIIASTCLGSIAVMAILAHGNGLPQMLMVFLAVAICNAYNAAILTVQKPKLVFNLLVASFIINTLLIIGNSIY